MTKMKNQVGTSLVEMLCVVLLVALLSMGMATGIGVASKQFIKSLRQSEAPQLYSTLEMLLTNELRYTTEVQVDGDGNVITMYSNTYAMHHSRTALVSLDKDNKVTSGYGKLAFGGNGEFNQVLGQASYPNGLGAKVAVKYAKDSHVFTVSLDIGAQQDSILNESFDVRALNDIAIANES